MGYCVYKHTSPSGKSYIGITRQRPNERWRNGHGYYQNPFFTSAIEKYGWDNFTHEILFDGLSKEDACEKEKELIRLYQSNVREHGYNLSSGGENPSEGMTWTDEMRERVSRSNKGKTRSAETRRRISLGKKGRSNGREGMVGKACPKSGIVLQIDEETKEVIAKYYGYYEMRKMTGFAMTPVKEAVYGIRKRAYGYLWEYVKRSETNVAV